MITPQASSNSKCASKWLTDFYTNAIFTDSKVIFITNNTVHVLPNFMKLIYYNYGINTTPKGP